MKKLKYLAALFIVITAVYFTGCKEDDTAPTITIIGEKHVITQKNAQYFDAGATASDDKDESVYVMSDLSEDNPDIDYVNDYTITYTAQDRSANASTATRVVSVTHTNWQLNHNYNVSDICVNDTFLNANYVSSVYVDTNYVFRTHFTNMTNLFSGLTYMEPAGKHITLPRQRPDGIFSPFIIEGSGSVAENTGIITIELYYTMEDTTNTIPMQTRHATFISF